MAHEDEASREPLPGPSSGPAARRPVAFDAVPLCPSCGVENVDVARFCGDCGTALDASCPSCGMARQPGKRFCIRCGGLLDQPTVALSGLALLAPTEPVSTTQTRPESPVSELRVCSVLFVDLVGFTPLSESKDPEEVRELLSEYFERAKTVISRYGGVVEKFIGDAVMAIWGTPVTTESDAERAVRGSVGPYRRSRGTRRGGRRAWTMCAGPAL